MSMPWLLHRRSDELLLETRGEVTSSQRTVPSLFHSFVSCRIVLKMLQIFAVIHCIAFLHLLVIVIYQNRQIMGLTNKM